MNFCIMFMLCFRRKHLTGIQRQSSNNLKPIAVSQLQFFLTFFHFCVALTFYEDVLLNVRYWYIKWINTFKINKCWCKWYFIIRKIHIFFTTFFVQYIIWYINNIHINWWYFNWCDCNISILWTSSNGIFYCINYNIIIIILCILYYICNNMYQITYSKKLFL